MPYKQSADFPIIVQRRNCSKCGNEYLGYPGRPSHFCQSCKAVPKPRPLRGGRKELFGQSLTVREFQIVNLVTQGLSNKEIANKLHLTEGTIKVFMGPILAKSGTGNRTALAVWWLRRGMDPGPIQSE